MLQWNVLVGDFQLIKFVFNGNKMHMQFIPSSIAYR